MTFKIETEAASGPDFGFGVVESDEALRIDLSNFTRAERFQRQAKIAVWAVEDETALDDYINAQSEMMDALYLAYPDLWTVLNENIEECRIGLRASAATPSAQADTGQAEPANSLGIKF